MEVSFAKLVKQLGSISPAAASSVFARSSRTDDEKRGMLNMLQELANESEFLADDPVKKTRKSGSTRATKREIIHEVLEKMKRKLQEYELDDHIDEWMIDFSVGTDYAEKTIDDIKAEHSRLVSTFQYLVVFRGSPALRMSSLKSLCLYPLPS